MAVVIAGVVIVWVVVVGVMAGVVTMEFSVVCLCGVVVKCGEITGSPILPLLFLNHFIFRIPSLLLFAVFSTTLPLALPLLSPFAKYFSLRMPTLEFHLVYQRTSLS